MKPGRNEPCHCGSGKKYKKCHLDPDHEAALALKTALPQFVEQQRQQARVEEKLRREYSVYINIVPPIQWDGGKVWAIGTRVYMHRPAQETFHEFLISLLRETFSEEWRQAQVALPKEDQHFLLRCSNEWARFKAARSDIPDENGLFPAKANGWVQYFINFAWDVGTLIHAATLPPSLIERLRDHNQFQGARYEVAVAAIFARLDCEIQFLDDNALRKEKHPEFIARHRPTGLQVAVEAKSRHRQGVINVPGASDDAVVVRGDVQKLFNKAISKAPGDMPFLVFIDVNAPPARKSGVENQWQIDVKNWMGKRYQEESPDPQPVSALAVTNFSPHYDGDDIAQGGEWLYFHLPNPQWPASGQFSEMVRQALDQYHRVPEITEGGEVRD